MSAGLQFVVLGANTPWVYALAEALAKEHPTTAICVYDWRTYYRNQVFWPARRASCGLRRTLWLFPPGFLGAFRSIFSSLIAIRLKGILSQPLHRAVPRTWLIAPYPWLAPPEIPIQFSNLVYYNLDDYPIYRPDRAARIKRQEEKTLTRARLVLCLAREQVRRFQSRPGVCAENIRHFPLGVSSELLAPREGTQVEPRTVAYVGNLGDRVHWEVVFEVARSMPEVKFDFIGGLNDITGGGKRPDWREWRSRTFHLPNVCHRAMVPQDQVALYYWKAGLNWIPYDIDHPFNMASCPTKIMDGLASGRPVLSTAVPECLLYPDYLSIFHSAAEAKSLIGEHLSLLAQGRWETRQVSQLTFVRSHLWSERAATLSAWLQSIQDN